MPTADQTRLSAARAHPRILDLWWALQPLRSVVRLMSSGAHPDDETSELLAALALRDGFNLSYACSTRGEGGQNDIGTETGPALGALRTREMERACDVLGMRLYWHSVDADDPITDFRFSKSGDETLAIWGEDRLIARFVQIVRSERPDILLPTFLDVPGQHGHHRAMTRAAHKVMAAAADPAFASNLPPWRIAKLYLPAWSGAGQAYDDDLPPPPATLTVPGAGCDPVSGWSYARIGQMSRGYHRTQGMGRWVPPGPGRDWPLHLAESHVAGPDDHPAAGLPSRLADLSALAPSLAADLAAADAAIAAAIAAFPELAAVSRAASDALAHAIAAETACPTEARADIAHRLAAKRVQLGHVLRLASGVEATARTAAVWLRPSDSTALTVEATPDADVTVDLPEGWHLQDGRIVIGPGAAMTDPYRTAYDPADPPAPRVILSLGDARVALPFDTPPVVLPPLAAVLSPDAVVVNLARPDRMIDLAVTGSAPPAALPSLDLPDGWRATPMPTGLRLHLPRDLPPGRHDLPLLLDGAPAMTERRIAHDHVDPVALCRPAILRLCALRADLASARIAYAGAGHDRVAHWLAMLGADVTDLGPQPLDRAALDGFDTLVIGIFALKFRPGLAAAMPAVRDWVQAGGTLVTLYHRPWDNWDPDQTPPRRIEIGQPSLRWRVTDADARVTQLADHPVLSAPNPIGAADWAGWVKERGLYFARAWDPAYTALLEMADPEEMPLQGALLSAEIGRGRHTHCALVLHTQMEALVPGAFRIMANLVAPRA